VSISNSIQKNNEGEPVLVVEASDFQKEFLLKEYFHESEILDRIPGIVFGGDPILGCLVRSGLSTSVGQIISYKNETAGFHLEYKYRYLPKRRYPKYCWEV